MPEEAEKKEKLRIALFDVDGTLINSGGAGSRSLFRALKEFIPGSGRPPGYIFDGKTDIIIIQELFAAHQREVNLDNPVIMEVLNRYTDFLDEELEAASKAGILGGVLPLVEALEAADRCVPGLLTGNIEQGAKKKLGHFGLWDHFRMGVFGNEGKSREALPKLALEKCRTLFDSALEPGDLVIIGDTPRDVACGKANGNRTIAVATGRFSTKELQACKPDHTFPDLENTTAVLQAILED